MLNQKAEQLLKSCNLYFFLIYRRKYLVFYNITINCAPIGNKTNPTGKRDYTRFRQDSLGYQEKIPLSYTTTVSFIF